MNRVICLFLGHVWIHDSYNKRKRKCGRCEKKQIWTFIWKYKDFYEGWL